MSFHMVRLPEPNQPHPAQEAARAPGALPFWHRDIALLDGAWADEAASVLEDLAKSDQQMVSANAFGSDGEKAALAYGLLLKQMTQLETDTVKRGKGSWLDNMHRKLLGDKRPLVERMEELMRNRNTLTTAARQRVNGLREALDIRSDVDERAARLLDRIPALEHAAKEQSTSATQTLADTPEGVEFAEFRDAQLRERNASRLPGVLLGVRQQLQNAVIFGAPLRDSIDQFLHLEQVNQSNFELAFGAHVSNLAVLQGMQQSAINSQAVQAALGMLPKREAGTSFSREGGPMRAKLEHRRAQDVDLPKISDRPPSDPFALLPEPKTPPMPPVRRPRL